jgi:hypothetical protein
VALDRAHVVLQGPDEPLHRKDVGPVGSVPWWRANRWPTCSGRCAPWWRSSSWRSSTLYRGTLRAPTHLWGSVQILAARSPEDVGGDA